MRLTGGVGTGASQPAIRLGAWAWSVVGFVLGNVDRHVLQHLADVLVRDAVEDVLGLAFAAHEARTAQQPQVMADQRLRQVERFGDVPHGDRAMHALQQDLHTSVNWAGWSITTYAFGFVLMLPISGRLSETGWPGALIFLSITITAVITGIRCWYREKRGPSGYFVLAVVTGLLTYAVHAVMNSFLDSDKDIYSIGHIPLNLAKHQL